MARLANLTCTVVNQMRFSSVWVVPYLFLSLPHILALLESDQVLPLPFLFITLIGSISYIPTSVWFHFKLILIRRLSCSHLRQVVVGINLVADFLFYCILLVEMH